MGANRGKVGSARILTCIREVWHKSPHSVWAPLTCQAPPGGFRPRTRWGSPLLWCLQVRMDPRCPQSPCLGAGRVSKSRATGLGTGLPGLGQVV